jgi:hypothetical protein
VSGDCREIAARLEMAGFSEYHIDYDVGVAMVFFPGRLERETLAETRERRKAEFRNCYCWDGVELRPRRLPVAVYEDDGYAD